MITQINKGFRSIDQQIALLEERGLIIEDKVQAKKELMQKNYFDLINGFETLLLVDSKADNKKYEDKYFGDFLSLYAFDRKLSSAMLTIISDFEIRLKTSIAYHFCEAYCSKDEHTLNYTDISNYYRNPADTNYLALHLSSHELFKIDSKGRNFITRMKSKYKYVDRYDKPPFWVTIKVLTLHELLVIVYNLSRPVLKAVLNDFGLDLRHKEVFVNSIEIIKLLRNHCAHFELVNRFRTTGSTRINSDLIKELKLNCARRGYEIRLFDAVKVLNKYQAIDLVKDIIVTYWSENISKGKEYINLELIKRMGTNDITDWETI
ncbi:Abi family protein [Brevibacillus sp. M2.1A]|uniref:Abi family protein n=1 Tax=Brevibacillus sp. M2.1A TaxID=2738980 RepID=UPI00156AD2D8|nr:Abi family protein [Brevibacillus sp. M2.1A]MCC8438571.1 Abi family protein [Brevibacillus sp. M2.1A]